MLYEGIKGEPDLMCEYKVNYKELFFLAIATSIDALAVGITLAFLNVSIIFSASVIAVTTFIISFIGVVLGKRFGVLTKNYAEVAGGLILIFIGTKILIEHLGIL
jgi:putative Mn2+ efflux pump MntP